MTRPMPFLRKAQPTTWESLSRKVLDWGEAAHFQNTMDLRPQFMRLIEQVGEISCAITRNDHERILDEVGRLLVALLQFGAIHSKSVSGLLPETYLEECLSMAWEQICLRASIPAKSANILSGDN